MLFFCWFRDDVVSLLVDAKDEKQARAIARDVAETAPSRVLPVPPGIIVGEVVETSEGEMTLDLLPHALHALDALEDDAERGGPGDMLDMVATEPADGLCGDANLDEHDNEVACTLADGHDGDHKCADLEWS
jgi:hypothetical protein